MRDDPRFLIGVALGLGLGLACKSLVVAVPLLLLSPWALHCTLTRADARTRWLAAAALLATALPYYVLSFTLDGEAFLRAHFLSLGDRVTAGGGVGMPGGRLAYVLFSLEQEGPVTSLWLALGSVGAIAFGVVRKRPELVLLGVFATGVIAALSQLSVRLPHYVLPAYPAAALSVGGMYADLVGGSRLSRARFGVMLGPALAMLVLLEARQHPGGDLYLFQRPWGRDLGLLAKRVTKPGETLYAHEWKATSLHYYSERPLVLLTADARRFAVVKPFVRALRLVPPPPAPVGSLLYVAGEAPVLSATPWLHVDEVLGASPPMFLVRARVVEPEATRDAPP
jgi:hypothetical protein